ncbi:MAG: SAM-dependent methyltransferase [Acidobacteriales bacterium]|nr:SAM-dependent methyltransferase [Terriglobales bacterium]
MPTPLKVHTIAVNSRAAKRLRGGHPWVYRSDLSEKTAGAIPAASLVHVTDERGKLLGSALASSSSQIALRMISEQAIEDEQLPQLVRERIAKAAAYRTKFVRESDAYRVVFSEADELPGTVVDRYNDVFTLQVLTQAMDRDDLRTSVVDALIEQFGKKINVVERSEPRIRQLEELPALESRALHGKKTSTTFAMNGLTFEFDAVSGQKSGAFLDQRENYAAAASYAHGEALDVFCYQGGFALHLARVCEKVTGVDSSRAALEVADQNATRNAGSFKSGEIEWIEANAFDLLRDYSAEGKQYDTIVLDPPAFAKSKRALSTAMRGYKELNLRALKMLRPGGILVTNSCSHHVSESDFCEMLTGAAVDANRRVKILEKRSQSKDHPVVATIPETGYLKCFVCYVD